MPRVTITLATAVALTLSHAVFAQERPVRSDPPPVRIERCAVESRSVLQDPFNGLRAEFVSGIAIRFRSIGHQPVSSVSLTVGYENASRTIVDRGSFAPGVPIDRTFAAFAGMTSGSDVATCRVRTVRFVDGTIWANDAAVP